MGGLLLGQMKGHLSFPRGDNNWILNVYKLPLKAYALRYCIKKLVYKCCLEELLLTGAMWPNYLLFQHGKHSIDLLTIPIGLYSLIEIRRGN